MKGTVHLLPEALLHHKLFCKKAPTVMPFTVENGRKGEGFLAALVKGQTPIYKTMVKILEI